MHIESSVTLSITNSVGTFDMIEKCLWYQLLKLVPVVIFMLLSETDVRFKITLNYKFSEGN